VPKGSSLVVWSSIGLWVGLVCGSKVFTLQLVGLGRSFGRLGWVEEIGPTDNSGSVSMPELFLSQLQFEGHVSVSASLEVKILASVSVSNLASVLVSIEFGFGLGIGLKSLASVLGLGLSMVWPRLSRL